MATPGGMKASWIAVCLCISSTLASPAKAAVIDLNEFFFDETVEVAPDGSTAMLQENPLFALVLLSLDPGLGDPNLIIPGSNVGLLFDYDIDLPASAGGGLVNNDRFSVFLFDASSGISFGNAFEFVTNSSATGELVFDLSTLTGSTIGLQFQLEALPGDLGLNSTATISNLRLEDLGPNVPSIPEPSTAFLLFGALALAGCVRRCHFD